MTIPLATREFDCISPTGERFAFTVHLGHPAQVSDEPESNWRCPVTIPFDDQPRDIFGIDSWQALNLALSLVHSLLADFIQRGGKLYHPGTTDEFTLNDFPHSTGNANQALQRTPLGRAGFSYLRRRGASLSFAALGVSFGIFRQTKHV